MELSEMSQTEMDKSEMVFRRKVETLINDIRNISEPSYDDRKWTEDNVCKYVKSLKEADGCSNTRGCKLFYLGDNGSVWQNEYIIESVVWYMRSWSLPSHVLNKLLSFENRIFRVEVKAETEPQSCVFVDRVYDLINIAVERRDAKLLQLLIGYIDFDNCTHYDREEILHIIEENGV